MNENNMNDRSFLYGRMVCLLDVYEKEARAAIGSNGASYIDMHLSNLYAKPHTTTKLCMGYIFKRTSFGKIMRTKKPELHDELLGMIVDVFSTIDDLYGDNDEPCYYAAVFGEFWQRRELDK